MPTNQKPLKSPFLSQSSHNSINHNNVPTAQTSPDLISISKDTLTSMVNQSESRSKAAQLSINNYEYLLVPLRKLVREINKTKKTVFINQAPDGVLIIDGGAFVYRINAVKPKVPQRIFLGSHSNSFGDKLVTMTEKGKYYVNTFPEGEHHESVTLPSAQWQEITFEQATKISMRGFNAFPMRIK